MRAPQATEHHHKEPPPTHTHPQASSSIVKHRQASGSVRKSPRVTIGGRRAAYVDVRSSTVGTNRRRSNETEFRRVYLFEAEKRGLASGVADADDVGVDTTDVAAAVAAETSTTPADELAPAKDMGGRPWTPLVTP